MLATYELSISACRPPCVGWCCSCPDADITSDRIVEVDPAVDVEVLYAPPFTSAQEETFAEAMQVFREAKVIARPLGSAHEVAEMAVGLLIRNADDFSKYWG